MPNLASIRASNLKLGSSLPYHPVAVFVGGTSGIGAGMARAFARHRNGDAHIVLVGRNRAAAEEIIASFPAPASKGAKYEFVECDVMLMKNIRRTTEDLRQRLPKVNFLVLSPGILTMQGRTETEEGIDKKLALHYYARWRFTYECVVVLCAVFAGCSRVCSLIPLLQKATDAGEDAKVMTVLSAGIEGGPIDLNDLGLKKNYTLSNTAKSASTYNDLMIQVCSV
jgi:NAD(P)-dependent dehydrogenase (short-subunit alcohol dehydrogenase family)